MRTNPTLELPLDWQPHPAVPKKTAPLAEELAGFREFGKNTVCMTASIPLAGGKTANVLSFVNEFWTAKQRAAIPAMALK